MVVANLIERSLPIPEAAVRIQSSAKIYIDCLLSTVLKLKKKRPGLAQIIKRGQELPNFNTRIFLQKLPKMSSGRATGHSFRLHSSKTSCPRRKRRIRGQTRTRPEGVAAIARTSQLGKLPSRIWTSKREREIDDTASNHGTVKHFSRSTLALEREQRTAALWGNFHYLPSCMDCRYLPIQCFVYPVPWNCLVEGDGQPDRRNM